MKTLQLKIPPVIVTLLMAVCMWITARLFPVFIVDLPFRGIMVSLLSILGGIVSALGILSFMLAKTSVNPKKFDSVSSLVVSGVYSVTRNPMYLGLLLVLLGWSYFLSNILAFVFIPIFVLYMNRFQIIPEELHLEAKFGKTFILYKSRVRRWL